MDNNLSSVLIITDEPVFSYGLRVQFRSWGFSHVEITINCEIALKSIQRQLPSLVIIDEKLLKTQKCSHLALIADLLSIPIIVLAKHPGRRKSIEGIRQQNNTYSYVNKPCQVAELKAVVEELLRINILFV